MKIIISPAKKMVENIDTFPVANQPHFIENADFLLQYLRSLKFEEAMKLWKCNEALAALNYDRIRQMDLNKNLTPALLAYQGIQYQYMAPEVLEEEQLSYLGEHLYILSGFYGALHPFDGVVPYRLEMQAKVSIRDKKDLYDYWGRMIYDKVLEETDVIINLASKEYSKCIEKYITSEITFVTCVFGELVNGKVVERGTYAKMARGEMVRYMAENNVDDIDKIKDFNRLGFEYKEEHSNKTTIVFLRNTEK